MKVGKRIEKTLRDGDGMHEGSDYIDEAIKVVRAIVVGKGVSSVHQHPGIENPGPVIWY